MDTEKYNSQKVTAQGKQRAFVDLEELKTLWFNTGTLCNLECKNCYIESSPKNDRLAYISSQEVQIYLDEIKENCFPVKMIGLTGGEPFINPQIIAIINTILKSNLDVLVLTNANRVLKKYHNDLLKLKDQYQNKLHLRISLDHHTKEFHEKERGLNTFDRTIDEIKWLYENQFNISIASRALANESIEASMIGHRELLDSHNIKLDLKEKLVIFPEMKTGKDLPEITTECWGILNKSPLEQMCASERMVVKRKGDQNPVVMPCTLLAYDDQFVLGKNLKDAEKKVYLNHPFCAEFCVLGGASCSSTN